jgi:hypothetical protein
MSTTYNCPHTLVRIWVRLFFKNMIHIAHPMCLAMFPLLHSTHVSGYKFGDTQIEDELVATNLSLLQSLHQNNSH